MNKLISKPTECGYRKQVFTRLGLPSGIFICGHSSKVTGEQDCYLSSVFPTDCPLQNGITIQSAVKAIAAGTLAINAAEDALTIAEKIESCGKSHKHTYYKNGNRVYPKRNRKDCKYHKDVYDHFGRCKNYLVGSTNICSGVNCGYFKTK